MRYVLDHTSRDRGRPTKFFGYRHKVRYQGDGFFIFFYDYPITMDQGHLFKFINIFRLISTRRVFNGIKPINLDKFVAHVNHYIYYSTEIKSKLDGKTENWFTYLQSSKNIYISTLISVNKLLNGCKYVGHHLQSLLINKAF